MKMSHFLLLCLICASCRHQSALSGIETCNDSVLEGILRALDSQYSVKGSPVTFTPRQQSFLKDVTFNEMNLLAHPVCFYKIKDIKSRQVELFFLNSDGTISSSVVVYMAEDDFWRPLRLLAKYYEKYGDFPFKTRISVPELEALVQMEMK